MGKDDVGLIKPRTHERTPSPIKQKKGVNKVSMGSPMKTPQLLKSKRGRKKFMNQLWNPMSMLTSTLRNQVEM
jgi:hypothetical protein